MWHVLYAPFFWWTHVIAVVWDVSYDRSSSHCRRFWTWWDCCCFLSLSMLFWVTSFSHMILETSTLPRCMTALSACLFYSQQQSKQWNWNNRNAEDKNKPTKCTNYRIFRPITCALSIQKGSEIVKNEHARYTLERFPNDNAHVICTIKVSENTVLCIKHNFQLKLVCSIHSVALLNITLFKSKKFFIGLPFSFATSTTSSLNLAVYDFLRELPVLPPSVGNSDANF